MLLSVLFAIFTFTCAQTQLDNGTSYTSQTEGSFTYYVGSGANMPGRIIVTIDAISSGVVSACFNPCEEDDAQSLPCSFADATCTSSSSCNLEIDVCNFARNTFYYLSIANTNSSGTFNVMVEQLAVPVPTLSSTPTIYEATTANYSSSLFRFEVSDNSVVNYVKATRRDGFSATGTNPSGAIYLPGDDTTGQFRTCGGVDQTTFTGFTNDYYHVMAFLNPSCGFSKGWYTIVLDNSRWNIDDWDIVVLTYGDASTEVPIGSRTHTLTTSSAHPFLTFYTDQGSQYQTDLDFENAISTSLLSTRADIFGFSPAVWDTSSTKKFGLPGYYGNAINNVDCEDQLRTVQSFGNFRPSNPTDFSIYPCSIQRGRYFISVFPRDLPFTFDLRKTDNDASFTQTNTTSLGVTTTLDNTIGTNKRTHYWKIDGDTKDADFYTLMVDNMNSTRSVEAFLTRGAPGGDECLTGNSFSCNSGDICNFGVDACTIDNGEGSLFLTLTYTGSQGQDNVIGSFNVNFFSAETLESGGVTTLTLTGDQKNGYVYKRNGNALMDVIEITKQNILDPSFRTRVLTNDDEGFCSTSNTQCTSYPCLIPYFCQNQGRKNMFTLEGADEEDAAVTYDISSNSYNSGSAYVTELTAGTVNTQMHVGPETHYYYFKTDVHEAYTITITKTGLLTSANYAHYRNDNCGRNSYTHSIGSASMSLTYTNIPAMDKDGKYWFTIEVLSGVNNTFSVLLETDTTTSAICRDVNADVSFCRNYIDLTREYALSSVEAVSNDDQASTLYDTYIFHTTEVGVANVDECKDDIKQHICEELFRPCNGNGASSQKCKELCPAVVKNCPKNDFCILENCWNNIGSLCVIEYTASSSSVFVSFVLLAFVAIVQLF